MEPARGWDITFGGVDIHLRIYTYRRWRRLWTAITRTIFLGKGPHLKVTRWEHRGQETLLDLTINADEAMQLDPEAVELFDTLNNYGTTENT